MKFVDESNIEVHAGTGGDGSASFRREKFIPRGGPDGGDGGRGGSILAIADRNINTLVEYRYARIHRARNGEKGHGSDCYGKAAEDITLRFPVGTVVTDIESGEVLADLSTDGQSAILAKGGQGVTTSAGLGIATSPLPRARTPLDTLMVPGGPGVDAAAADAVLVDWVRQRTKKARRVASVCTGAFLLGASGALDGVAQLRRQTADRLVNGCEQHIQAPLSLAVTNVNPPGPRPRRTMLHELASDEPRMFSRRRLVRQIHSDRIADRALWGLQVEEIDRHCAHLIPKRFDGRPNPRKFT